MQYPMLGIRKQKKAILKNAKNIQDIHDMYYELTDYKIIYPDRTEIKKKYKYKLDQILNKFNINSNNELLFLLIKYRGKKIRTCEFCNEDMFQIQLRTTVHYENCGHTGICILCKKPYTSCNKDKICYECTPYVHEASYIDRLLYSLFNCSDFDQIEYNYNTEKEINYAISFLTEKLNMFKKILKLKGFSRNENGSKNKRNNSGRTFMREDKKSLLQ